MAPTEQEIAELYSRYSAVIFHRARCITGNDEEAHDAVQETFARVIRHWEAFRGEASPLTWMSRITTNWCLNQIRNRKGRSAKHTDHLHEIVPEAFSWLAPRSDAATVRRLLEEVDEETRAVVIHLYFDDMTREETASAVGISVPTVRKRLDGFLKRSHRVLTTRRAPAAGGLALLCLGLLIQGLWGIQ